MANRAFGGDSLVGLRLGHYLLVEKIGAGGMGDVYRARDEHLDRDVAIKVLPSQTFSDDSARKRFRQEALALSKLNHPNIATIHDFDVQQGIDFLVMEYIPGITLSEKLAGQILSEKEVIALGTQLAEGLSEAHEHGVIHRDLKPGNLRLTRDKRLKILDFGLAKLRLPVTASGTTASIAESHRMAGTLPYMAPEQLLGREIDARTDIHAAGSVLYEMATGQRPFAEVEHSQVIGAILGRPPRPPRALNPHSSPELERIIGKCLEKEPEDRYQSAKELAIDLRRLQTGESSGQQSTPPIRRSWRRRAVGALAIIMFAAIGAGIWGLRGWRTKQTPEVHINSLAVLPLENLSGDPSQDYFADGMTDELINRLARMGEMRVISRTSIMRYKGVHKPLREIARELGIDAVVEGSAARAGDRVRISAELIVAANEQHLWGDSYTRDLRDVLQMQDEVAEAIAHQIRGTLLRRRTTPPAVSPKIDPGVYEEYLLGRQEWNKRTIDGTSAALEHFRRAIAKDAGYAPAYSGVADCYVTLWLSLGALSRDQALTQARQALDRALILDADLADAHSTVGTLRMYADWDWPGAEAEYKRAIALNPSYATAHHWYGLHLAFRGKIQEARQELEQARELDPFSPIIRLNLAWVQFSAGDNDALIAASQKELASDSSFWDAHWDLGSAYVQKGELEKGIAALQEAVELSHHSTATLSSLGYALGRAGKRREAEQVLRKLNQRAQHEPVAAEEIAMVYVGLGDNNNALLWLEQAYRAQSKGLVLLKADPFYHSLAEEPRYRELVRKVGLSGD
jgi:serine/threonine protein kinase/tetratricopeptide (TPR) repeat protein